MKTKKVNFLIVAKIARAIPIVVCLSSVEVDGAAEESEIMIAMHIRESIALGPIDVLPALSGGVVHRLVIDDGVAYVGTDEYNLRILVATLTAANGELSTVLAKGEDPSTAFANVELARAALALAGSPLVATLEGRLPENLRPLVARVTANGALDPDLRPLALTERQRADLLAAQRTRDTVLLDARNWYQDRINAAANAQYEAAVQSILTEAQRGRLAGYRQVLESRRVEMAAAEAEAFDHDPR